MSWTQKQLDEFFRKLNQRASTDPEFRKKFSENSKAAMEEVAGRELPDEFSLKLIEHNGNYSVAFVAPDFPQGEVELRELTENEQDQVNAGLSFFLIVSVCLAAVAVGACGADVCGANACGGNACAGNACGADACGGAACGANAGATGACSGNACYGDACGANAGCLGYASKKAPCGKYVGCKFQTSM
ncbi:MAG: hypothetical protein IKI84_14805 [Clostridia bacterium]|nr:hypothetical protein [Clostridia bacterium]